MSTSLFQHRSGDRAEPSTEAVLDALADDVCRAVLETLKAADSPRTANELSEACEVPLSTLYRKLELLTDASLVEETIQLRTAGKHTCQYETVLDGVDVRLSVDGGFDVRVSSE